MCLQLCKESAEHAPYLLACFMHARASTVIPRRALALQDTSSGGGKVKQTEPASVSKMLLTETAEPSDEAIIVPSSSSVDVTDVSRMGFDLRRNAMVGDRNKVDPEEADKRFVELLVKLLEKVSVLSSDLVLIPAGQHTAMRALQAASCERSCHCVCNGLHPGQEAPL